MRYVVEFSKPGSHKTHRAFFDAAQNAEINELAEMASRAAGPFARNISVQPNDGRDLDPPDLAA